MLIAEVGVICPEPWGVTESGSGGNRECEGAERVEQVGRAGDDVLLLCFEVLAPESGESSGRLSAVGERGSRGAPCVALVMRVPRGEVTPSLPKFFGELLGAGAGGGEVALSGAELDREHAGSGLCVPRVAVSPAQLISGVSEIAVAGDGQIMEREAPTFDEGIFF